MHIPWVSGENMACQCLKRCFLCAGVICCKQQKNIDQSPYGGADIGKVRDVEEPPSKYKSALSNGRVTMFFYLTQTPNALIRHLDPS